MTIFQEVNKGDFYQWLKQSSGYQNNFSYEGAAALFDYYDQLSDEIDEPIEFDPIAWCCDFSEYEGEEVIAELLESYNVETIDDLRDLGQVIEISEQNILFCE